MNILLIVAAGKSSRFGGFPKAFSQIGNATNVENTIKCAKESYDRVYIGVNQRTYDEYHNKISDCEMFSIVTGQGDAHSLLKCLKYINKKEKDVNNISVCWGDAIFVDESPFKQLLEGAMDYKVAIACCNDENPYAWFEVNENNEVLKSHFAKEEGFVERGIHDQSLFNFKLNFAIQYLDDYRKLLGIADNNDESKSDQNEMKLLHSFEYLYKSSQYKAKCIEITSNKVLSFNTKDELKEITKLLCK